MLRRVWLPLLLSFAIPAFAAEVDVPALAKRLLTAGESNPDNLFRLQLVVGDYDAALRTMPRDTANIRWRIYANARQREASGVPFDDAFAAAFRETMRTLDDKTAYQVGWTFGTSPVVLQNALRDALAKNGDPIDLVRKYFSAKATESFTPIIGGLLAEENARRYVIERDLRVGAVCATIVRPRGDTRLPALLNFTIYAEPDDNFAQALRTAANGFAGVVGLTRGKGCSDGPIVPYVHDAEDAAALIDWIAAQTWSDGRVGMYGGSYEGGTPWAAAKRMPKALKAIMDGAPVAPGIDVPMEGNVVWNFIYPWPFYTTDNKTLDNATYGDAKRWQRIDHDYYVSGRAYRDLDKIDGTPNPIFDTWIAHPSYDRYWRAMIPYGEEFARIDIPVLTTAGYYFGGPGAATYYFTEHTKHRPGAEHYLVIGPYDHFRAHGGTINVVGAKAITNIAGYEIEPAAHLDMAALRYQWFDWVFGRGPKPAMLADKVNYAVVGANRWKHAPSLAAMSNAKLKIPVRGVLTVNLSDRSDVDREVPGGGIVDKTFGAANGLTFTSEPLGKATEVSGLFSGHLEFVTNKKDFDFEVDLYAKTPAGDVLLLAPYWTRASYAASRETRHLLQPGAHQKIDFTASRLMSNLVPAGSRIIAVVRVIKEPGRQINYGSGKDVNDETIADAGEPLRIEWVAGSFVDVPVWR